MIGVHVHEDGGCGLSQRVRFGMSVVPGLDPAHHPEATDVVDIDRLETEEAEVGEIHPIPAILMASEVLLSNGSKIVFRHRLSVSNEGRSCGPKRVTIGTHLRDEEAAARVSFQVLGVHGHIADEKSGPTRQTDREGHQGTEWESRTLARQRREGGNRDKRHKSPDTLGMGWLRQLRQSWSGGCVLAVWWFGRCHGLPLVSCFPR